MAVYNIHCPHCGELLEGVNTGVDLRKINRPEGFRCSGCGKGWEVLQYVTGGLLLSSASYYDKPNLKVKSNG